MSNNNPLVEQILSETPKEVKEQVSEIADKMMNDRLFYIADKALSKIKKAPDDATKLQIIQDACEQYKKPPHHSDFTDEEMTVLTVTEWMNSNMSFDITKHRVACLFSWLASIKGTVFWKEYSDSGRECHLKLLGVKGLS